MHALLLCFTTSFYVQLLTFRVDGSHLLVHPRRLYMTYMPLGGPGHGQEIYNSQQCKRQSKSNNDDIAVWSFPDQCGPGVAINTTCTGGGVEGSRAYTACLVGANTRTRCTEADPASRLYRGDISFCFLHTHYSYAASGGYDDT